MSKILKTEAYSVRIFISGPMHIIEQCCREYVTDVGLCINVSPTKYIYVGGEETGAIIELINYARFPDSPERLWEHAEALAHNILDEACQGSFTIMDNTTSMYYSRREDLEKNR